MVDYSDFDGTFSALADPTRRAILQQLMNGPARITEIARPFSMSLNAVSKHVRILERARLIERDIRGREHWIRFNRGPLHDARSWTDAMLAFWDARAAAMESPLAKDKESSND